MKDGKLEEVKGKNGKDKKLVDTTMNSVWIKEDRQKGECVCVCVCVCVSVENPSCVGPNTPPIKAHLA